MKHPPHVEFIYFRSLSAFINSNSILQQLLKPVCSRYVHRNAGWSSNKGSCLDNTVAQGDELAQDIKDQLVGQIKFTAW